MSTSQQKSRRKLAAVIIIAAVLIGAFLIVLPRQGVKAGIVLEITHADGTVDRLVVMQPTLSVGFATQYGTYYMKTTDTLSVYPTFTATYSNPQNATVSSFALSSNLMVSIDSTSYPRLTYAASNPWVWDNSSHNLKGTAVTRTFSYNDLNTLAAGVHSLNVNTDVSISVTDSLGNQVSQSGSASVQVQFTVSQSGTLSLVVYASWGVGA
jgi:hypothetical protein